MRRHNYFWAVILILVGCLLLINNLDIVEINVWKFFWPIFLIILGAWFLWGATMGQPTMEEEKVSLPLEGASQARILVKHGAGRLHINDSASPDELLAGSFRGGLDHRIDRDGDSLDLRLKTDHQGIPFLFWAPGFSFDWTFGLNPDLPLALEFETGAGATELDLTNLQVTDLILKTGASSTVVTMPANAGHTHVEVEAGAAAVKFNIPQGVAARIHTDSGLAAINIDQERFPRQGKIYQSPDYETANNKIDFEIETGVSSVSIN